MGEVKGVTTVQFLIAGLIITMVVISALSAVGRIPFGGNVEEPDLQLTASYHISCSPVLTQDNGVEMSWPRSFDNTLWLTASNPTSSPVAIDRVAVYVGGTKVHEAPVSVVVPPKQAVTFQVRVNQTGGVASVNAFPGDVLALSGPSLSVVSKGTLFSSTTPPGTPVPPPGYVTPYGTVKEVLTVAGNTVSAAFKSPGTAPISLYYSYGYPIGEFLALASFKPIEHSTYSVPFLLDGYSWGANRAGVGFRMIPSYGTDVLAVDLFGTQPTPKEVVSREGVKNVALYYNAGTINVYLNSTRQPLTLSGLTNSVYGVAYGVAQDKLTGSVSSRPPVVETSFTDVAGNVVSTVSVDLSDYTVTVNGLKLPLQKYSPPAWWPDIMGVAQSDGAVALINVEPGSWFIYDYTFLLMRVIEFEQPPVTGAVEDVILVLAAPSQSSPSPEPPPEPPPTPPREIEPLGTSSLTGDYQQDYAIVRLVRMQDGSLRVSVYAATGALGQRVSVSYGGSKLIYVKPPGEVAMVRNYYTINYGIFYTIAVTEFLELQGTVFGYPTPVLIYPRDGVRTAIVTSDVYYLGVFKSQNLTIRGLPPGSVVTVSANGASVSLATSGEIAIPLLNYFTAEQLVNAVLAGGLVVEVNTAPNATLTSADRVLVHISGNGVDAWREVRFRATTSCVATFKVQNGNFVAQRVGDAWVVNVTAGTRTFQLGLFPKFEFAVRANSVNSGYVDVGGTVIRPNDCVAGYCYNFDISGFASPDGTVSLLGKAVASVRGRGDYVELRLYFGG